MDIKTPMDMVKKKSKCMTYQTVKKWMVLPMVVIIHITMNIEWNKTNFMFLYKVPLSKKSLSSENPSSEEKNDQDTLIVNTNKKQESVDNSASPTIKKYVDENSDPNKKSKVLNDIPPIKESVKKDKKKNGIYICLILFIYFFFFFSV